jgi:hypothetical protein
VEPRSAIAGGARRGEDSAGLHIRYHDGWISTMGSVVGSGSARIEHFLFLINIGRHYSMPLLYTIHIGTWLETKSTTAKAFCISS